jgi:hypothetical protein
MDEHRLQLLLNRYFDQLLAGAERRELEEMLLAFPRARQLFWDSARTNALIRNWGEAEWGRQEASPEKLHRSPPGRWCGKAARQRAGLFRRLLVHWLLPACAAALVLFLGLAGYHEFVSGPGTAARPGIAVLTRISEEAWTDDRQVFQPGESLPPGWLRLDRGAVEIVFSRGARVVIEGPAEVQLVSENEMRLRSGKLRAHVPPPAHGFKVVAANFTVVDHGTDFGCIIGRGASEIHVFTGNVSWQPDAAGVPGRLLEKSQAIRFSNQRAQTIPADPAEFLSETELARLDEERQAARLAAWRKSSDWLRNNPATLVFFDFKRSPSDPGILPNLAAAAPPNSEASIIGCDTVNGRWLHKPALEFRRPNDCLRLNIPGEHPVLTFLAWIRVDGLAHRQQALAMTEDFRRGEIHWYLHRYGSLSLAEYINTNSPAHGWRDYQSPPIFNAQNYGTWAMIATVCDSKTGDIFHYYNGRPVGVGHARSQRFQVPFRLDTFEIGNWGVRYNDSRWSFIQWGNPADAVRNFHGRMDEFAIMDKALSPERIKALFRAGRPGETIFANARQN